MERIEPSNSVKMPAMNFGVYWITDPTECEAAVLSAWRGIDTAASYLNERAVGRAVARSGIPCSELFISTKLWVQDASEAGAERAIRRSLELLRTDTIDLYQIHQPYGDIYGAWRTMERFYEAGDLRAIGVSNFQPDRITDFALHQRIRSTVNQIEVNPFCQQREADAVNRVLGMGALCRRQGRPLRESRAQGDRRRPRRHGRAGGACVACRTRHHLDLEDRLARTHGGEPRRLKREAHARGHGENRDARHGHEPLFLSSRPEDRRVALHSKAAF